jgi:hypothetical protein
LPELLAQAEQVIAIHVEHCDRGPSDGRSTEQVSTHPSEMAVPRVPARVEKAGQPAPLWVHAGDVRALVRVAERTNMTHAKLTAIDPMPTFR